MITPRESSRRGEARADARDPRGGARASPSVEQVVLAPFELDADPGELPALEVDSETPYLLTYTSGTTGKPKGVLHVQGGFLVSIAREAAYQADVHAGDVMHFATDMGWIMGPWTVVGVGALGGTIVFAEGAPDWPRRPALAHRRAGARHVARPLADARARAAAARRPDAPTSRRCARSSRPASRGTPSRTAGCPRTSAARACRSSTARAAPRSAPASSRRRRSGRSRRARSAGPALGMAMDIVDDDGNSLVGTGEVGELVCRKPFPGMTRGFWRDPEKYLETYWSRIPGVWVHGDWASVDADGFWFLHGRSDDTLNIAGKRIGPAELESAAVEHPAVREAAAIGVPHEVKGETAWIFCCLLPGAEATRGRDRRARRGRARQGVQARSRLLRRRAAEDPLGEDRAARREGDRARRRPRRPLVAREPRVTRPDRSSSWLKESHSSPAAAAASAPTSRARSRRTAGRSSSPHARAARSTRSPRRSAAARSSSTSPRASRSSAASPRPGHVELLVANAGVGERPSDWWHTFEVNVLGVHLCCEAALPAPAAPPHRHHRQRRRLPAGRARHAYTASKAAVVPLRRDAEQRARASRSSRSAPGSSGRR